MIGEGLAELRIGPAGDGVAVGCGGDAANICVMAALLGGTARLLGRVGTDALGRRLLAFWGDRGVDLTHVVADPDAATGLYLNERACQDGHRFTYHRHASAGSRLGPHDLRPEFFDGLDFLVVTGVTQAISASAAATALAAVDQAADLGVPSALVLNYRPALGADRGELRDLASRCDLLIASSEDAEAVFDVDSADALASASGHREIVWSDGAGPAVLLSGGKATAQPPPAVDVANAAGAGDALAGAYLACLDRGGPAALAWSVAAASLSVERPGCADSYPAPEEIIRRVRELPPTL